MIIKGPEFEMTKFQAPITKYSMTKTLNIEQRVSFGDLDIGYWDLFGIWNLIIGVLLLWTFLFSIWMGF
jgi:hypothetical protein